LFPVFRSNATFGFIGLFRCNQKSKCRTVYLSCEIASGYSCGKTKTTQIVKRALSVENNKVVVENKPRFFVLSKLAKTLLVLPNSNADSERAFSLVKKIATEFRADLNKDTLCALLSCKMNTHLHCYELKPSAVLLKNAKSATMEYNNSLK